MSNENLPAIGKIKLAQNLLVEFFCKTVTTQGMSFSLTVPVNINNANPWVKFCENGKLKKKGFYKSSFFFRIKFSTKMKKLKKMSWVKIL